MDNLSEKISLFRSKLIEEIHKTDGGLGDKRVIELSRELDGLINEYLGMYKKNSEDF
jgi:hypothetical protein